MFFGKENPDLETFADLLIKGTVGLYQERGEVEFSGPPQKTKRQIVDAGGSGKRMRADGMEKFDNEPTYVSVVNYYVSAKDLEKDKAVGALVVYVQQAYIARMMRLLKYPPIDDEDEQAMMDSCGTLCNIIAGRFKSEVSQAGYIELEMSHFKNYRNSAFAGVGFCPTEYHLYEVSFLIERAKRLVLEMSMGVVPRR